MAQENADFVAIQTLLEHVGNDQLINDIVQNVQLEPFDGVLKTKRNRRKILEFLQKKFGLTKYAYAKGQKNYWIMRGFSAELAAMHSKQYSGCYSRSPSSIVQKYNCTLEQAQQIFARRNQKAQQTRNNFSTEEKLRINKLKRHDKQSMINRYGEEEGVKRYNSRIEKFKRSMSLDHLIDRYGEEEGKKIYEARNASRSSSLDTLVAKYGEQEGRLRYNRQCQKKSHAQTLQGYIDRYGVDLGCKKYQIRQQKFLETWNAKTPDELARIRSLQAMSLDKMIDKYGKTQGYQKYQDWLCARNFRASNESLKVFLPLYTWLLDKGFCDNDIFFGHETKKEYFIKNDKEFFSYDFCIKSIKLIIEFNGLVFHPKSPNQKDWRCPYNNITAEQKFNYDQHKIQIAKQHGFTVLQLWEDVDCATNLSYTIDVIQALKELNSEEN